MHTPSNDNILLPSKTVTVPPHEPSQAQALELAFLKLSAAQFMTSVTGSALAKSSERSLERAKPWRLLLTQLVGNHALV